jgi:hypothetical protein
MVSLERDMGRSWGGSQRMGDFSGDVVLFFVLSFRSGHQAAIIGPLSAGSFPAR